MSMSATRPDRDDATPLEESVILKDLIITAISNVAAFAHHARRFMMTDATIDRFVATILATTLLDTHLTREKTLRSVEQAEIILNRSKNLYYWSCEAFSRRPDPIRITPVLPDGWDLAGLEAACAALRHQRENDDYHDTHYWKHVAVSKLGNVAAAALKMDFDENKPNDIFAFIHKTLTTIANGLSVFELVALVQLIENAQLNLVSPETVPDTLVDLPAADPPVRESDSPTITEPAPPPDEPGHSVLG